MCSTLMKAWKHKVLWEIVDMGFGFDVVVGVSREGRRGGGEVRRRGENESIGNLSLLEPLLQLSIVPSQNLEQWRVR